MPKASQTPATAINNLMEEYQLNPSSLAKRIGLSASAVRKMSLGEAGISVPTALRLAKLFGNSPSYWLDIQLQSDMQAATANKELQAALKAIPKAAKPVKKAPEKKPAEKKVAAKKTPEKKLAGKKAPEKKARGRKPSAATAAKKTGKSPRKKV